MPATHPYQPSQLRLLHGAMAALVPLAWLSGLLVYSTRDGRWGQLPWQPGGDWIDIHGSIGVALWPLALLFALYAITLGRARLNQAPNAVALLALSLAVVSGKLMNEDWLRTGQLHHVVYDLHLLAWLLIAITVVWHLAGVFRRGGVALARSMFRLELRGHDRPRHWPSQWSNWFQRSRHR